MLSGEYQRVEITREEFTRLTGIQTELDISGVTLYGWAGQRGSPIIHYAFVEQPYITSEIEWLENLYKL